jgi:hypothetical protein
MGTGTLLTLAGWLAALLLGWVTVSCLARIAIARFTRGHSVGAPDYGLLLPELSGGACLAVLAALGVHPLLSGPAAAVVLAVALLPAFNTMRLGVKQGKAADARREVGRVMRLMLQTARYLPVRDLAALFGLFHRDAPGAPAAAVPGRPAPGRIRTVPPVTKDLSLGAVPPPGAVSDYLELQKVAVPADYAALAERVATFEADDVDDWRSWWLEQAAGILTVAAAFHEQGEHAGIGRGLDPAVVAAITDFSEIYSEVAPAAVMVIRRHDDTYRGVEEHVDAGGTLPEDAPGWWNARGAGPQGGQAA